jgi:MFS family permease
MTIPRSLFVVAALAGLALANTTVALPLLVLAAGRPASVAGALLAAETAATALGAMFAAPVRQRLGGAPNALVIALVLVGSGDVVLVSAASAAGLAAGAVLLGTGIGVFWVSSQVILGTRSGAEGSEGAFLTHYALFTTGMMIGSALTGTGASMLGHFGLDRTSAIRATLTLGLAAALFGLRVWWPCACPAEIRGNVAPRLDRRLVLLGLRVQVPDLLLVAGLSMLVPLMPIILTDVYHVSASGVGLIMAGVAIAKIAGTLVARRLVCARGSSFAILVMIAIGAGMCLLVIAAFRVWLFVPAVLATVVALAGAWPLVVDAGQARTAEHVRSKLTVAWNVREYAVIAATTVGGAWLYTAVGRATPLFVLSAVLLLLSALAAAFVLSMPVVLPAAVARP